MKPEYSESDRTDGDSMEIPNEGADGLAAYSSSSSKATMENIEEEKIRKQFFFIFYFFSFLLNEAKIRKNCF